MSNTKKTIDMPDLSERDVELLICALRSAEGGFPKVSHIIRLSLCFFS